ncbi:MAG: DNA polymerase IV [bacterium]|nr:DNA polymerase IV [bacterium]MDE0287379.1 DNA polymerase IV [bacterium]MDE0438382.1 DNA polymerase IV [bacterium]
MDEPRIAEPILHVDMDAFYVEVERLDDRGLVGQPVVVGGEGPRGVVASASYEVRAAGVRSAMPMSTARRMCPGLVIVAPRHGRYGEISEQVFSIFQDFTPLVQGLSVDEAFLDIRGLRRHYPNSLAVAEAIRTRIRRELHLPASVGAATSLYLAKMASGYAKPDGVHIVTEGSENAFLEHLDVQELWGVGRATRRRLASMGVGTVGQLARVPLPLLRRHLGDATGDHLHRLANGVDERVVEPYGGAKSVSVEQTFREDISGVEALRSRLLRQADQVAWRLRRAGLSGRTVSLKIRFADFRTITRAETLRAATDVSREVYQSCCRLLDRAEVGVRSVRLLGVAVSGLQPSDAPRQLMVDQEERWEHLEEAIDELRVRFGRHVVEPARLRRPDSDHAARDA